MCWESRCKVYSLHITHPQHILPELQPSLGIEIGNTILTRLTGTSFPCHSVRMLICSLITT